MVLCFIKKLIKNPTNKIPNTNHLYHHKLFYTEQISISKNFELLSDTEFVKRLIDYISKPKSEISEKDKSTMNRIKLIALENDLI